MELILVSILCGIAAIYFIKNNKTFEHTANSIQMQHDVYGHTKSTTFLGVASTPSYTKPKIPRPQLPFGLDYTTVENKN